MVEPRLLSYDKMLTTNTRVGTRKDHRIIFTSHDVHVAHNDDNFAKFKYEEHQTMVSPLVKYNITCVSSFSLDYMHLVRLGVVRRILFFWKTGPHHCRLSHSQLTEVSELLHALTLPQEFACQTRSLFEVEWWKATEFQSFLLYTGPVVLKKVICKKSYETFMALSIAVGIMLEANAEERAAYLDYAKNLLSYFVCSSEEVFGETFVVYNVHSLVHLHEDNEHFQCSLNEISAFKFENHLQQIKQLVR